MGFVGIISFGRCTLGRSSFSDRHASAFVMFGLLLGDVAEVEEGFFERS